MYFSDINDILQYRIISGGNFEWKCWPNGRYIDYRLGDIHATIVVNTTTGEIYEATAHEVDTDTPYRWLNPAYSKAYLDESINRGVDASIAWDNVHWNDLIDADDLVGEISLMIQKMERSSRKTETIEISLTQNEFSQLALAAHNKGITFNEYVNEILEDYINKNGN